MASRKGKAGDAPIYGVSAEFTTPGALLEGVRTLRTRDVGQLETHTPIPIAGLNRALGNSGSLTRYAVLAAVLGFASMMALCIYATAYDYVFDIGGRPLVSWPSFMVPSLSFGMLAGALTTGLSMLFTNRLPRLNHPSFNIPNFTRASQDRFFLTITPASEDPLDLKAIARAFEGLDEPPVAVEQVPR